MHHAIPAWLEIGTLAIMAGVLLLDLVIASRWRRVPRARESAIWIAFYVALALAFAATLFVMGDTDAAGQFVAGWLTEYSLSADNLFVFVIIMGTFLVPRELQQFVLMAGIIIALVLRGLFILLGIALIDHFAWIFYILGAFLLYTAVQQVLLDHRKTEQDTESRIIRILRRRVPITHRYDGARLTVRVDGKLLLTPILVVLIAIGVTDLVFALDSIPAIFGITQDAFLVFAANIFALMGLRQLFFLLGSLIDRLAYLVYGVGAILVFIAVKLILHALHTNEVFFINGGKPVQWAPEIGTVASLVAIVAALGLAIGASLVKLRVDRGRAAA